MNRTFIYSALIVWNLTVAGPIDAFEPSPALVAAWAQDWQKRIDGIVGSLIEEFEEPLLLKLDPQGRQIATEEFRSVFYSAITWDVVSEEVVNSITLHCDSDVLTKIEPYVVEDTDASEFDQDVLKDYASCYSDAMYYSEAGALNTIVAAAMNSQDIFSKYERELSSYQYISPIVTTAAVESEYGETLDKVISLHQISDKTVQQRQAEALKSMFITDPSVLHVALEDPGHPGSVYGRLFYFYQNDKSPPGKSCSGASPPEQKGLMRCSWNGGGYGKDNVIKYTRRFNFRGEDLDVIIEFDYAELLQALHN